MARLIVMAGLPGCGKSTIARALAAEICAVWLRIDAMDQAIWTSADAPRDLRDWTYRAAQAVAADNLALGRDVIGDAVNDWREEREAWDAVARRAGAETLWLEIVCSDLAEHRRRVETRTGEAAGLVLPSWDEVLRRRYAPFDRARARIDTAGRAIDDCVREALWAAGGGPLRCRR